MLRFGVELLISRFSYSLLFVWGLWYFITINSKVNSRADLGQTNNQPVTPCEPLENALSIFYYNITG